MQRVYSRYDPARLHRTHMCMPPPSNTLPTFYRIVPSTVRPLNIFIAIGVQTGSALLLPLLNMAVAVAVVTTSVAVRINGINRARTQQRAILAVVAWNDAVRRPGS